MQDLIDHYLKEHLTRLSNTNAAEQKSMMVKLIAPHWGKNLVTEITKSEVAKLLTKIAEGRARPHKPKPNNRGRASCKGQSPRLCAPIAWVGCHGDGTSAGCQRLR